MPLEKDAPHSAGVSVGQVARPCLNRGDDRGVLEFSPAPGAPLGAQPPTRSAEGSTCQAAIARHKTKPQEVDAHPGGLHERLLLVEMQPQIPKSRTHGALRPAQIPAVVVEEEEVVAVADVAAGRSTSSTK